MQDRIARRNTRVHRHRDAGEGLLPGTEEFSRAGLLGDPSLDDAGKQEKLLENLRRIYREQGIEVPDRILKDGVAALRDSRFTYTPPGPGLKRRLATLYVRRGALSRRLFGILAALGIGWGAYQFLVVQPERQAATEAATNCPPPCPRGWPTR